MEKSLVAGLRKILENLLLGNAPLQSRGEPYILVSWVPHSCGFIAWVGIRAKLEPSFDLHKHLQNPP
jgi:hypothetical protein